MSDTSSPPPSQPAADLGLMFLLIGLTFALPLSLLPAAETSAISPNLSPQAANVYACVAWTGLAHFIYSFRGQGKALKGADDSLRKDRFVAYGACVALAILVLVGVRWALGIPVFGAIIWIYFIDHFIKAEQLFEGRAIQKESIFRRWFASHQPILAFGWLSAVLLNVGDIDAHRWVLWVGGLLIGGFILAFGGWRGLLSGQSRIPLLSLLFVGESLVWGAYSVYGGPSFLTGVYFFHIAAGSYFHYFGSYFFGNFKSQGKDGWLNLATILLINVAVIAIGYLVAHNDSLKWLRPVFGVSWFTLWVGVHLVISDVFPSLRSWHRSRTPQIAV